mgnify:FL=1
MITECEIKEFLYEIDEPLGVENCVLSDEQINHLARQIFNNKEKLLELIKSEWNKRIVGFVLDWWFVVDIYVDGALFLRGLDR